MIVRLSLTPIFLLDKEMIKEDLKFKRVRIHFKQNEKLYIKIVAVSLILCIFIEL